MALAPKFVGQKLAAANVIPKAVHTLELYLDYVCPFSKKMFNTVFNTLKPTITSPPYADRLVIIFRQQIQPWHPSSTLVHEAGAAVLRLAPDKFFDFSKELFEQQAAYFDVNVKEVYQLLVISDKPGPDGALNTGNRVTNDVKLMVKANRLVGVHVTPTVLFNGIVENSISSSWTKEQWEEWLKNNV
ncbi:hypothetical protein AOQ84DRAFT_396524 [Glonium stellatum]|uniref:Thioredoxin-like fold domain-containing protein n=1 Tax=Glonium stellatum TaxID=574774 RepID=A0A8E2F5W4_9PEZI|nr:hypothetical protein AOQ84DRAFT_396524 [Glonium stellatum]